MTDKTIKVSNPGKLPVIDFRKLENFQGDFKKLSKERH